MLLLLQLGCAAGASQGAPAATAPTVIDGRWELQSGPAQRHPQVFSFDLWPTGQADSLSGRLVLWMSGDMGIEVSRYGPIAGTMAGDSVSLRIAQPAPSPVLRIVALHRGDTLTVTESWVGEDPGQFNKGDRFLRSGAVGTP